MKEYSIKNFNLKVGDKVRLNSGGPIMIIECIRETEKNPLICSWFDSNGYEKVTFYDPRMLAKISK